MAKPYENAVSICTILTIAAAFGIFLGYTYHSPVITIIFLLPAVAYEVYRTEGETTKWASWALLGLFIAEFILIAFNINYDLASFLARSEQYIGGYTIPLGDIKLVGPAIMAVLSIILFVRTGGVYTKWLSVIIFITSFALIYIMDPTIFERYIQLAVNQIPQNINI
jgi:hypothetical protein